MEGMGAATPKVQEGIHVATIFFPYPSPPITANQRLHWRAKARLTKEVRTLAAHRASGVYPMGKCRVTLTWIVTTSHRRDADNVVPTLKAMCDGLVDAGVVTDDTPDLMEKLMPVIVKVPKDQGPARMELRVERIS